MYMHIIVSLCDRTYICYVDGSQHYLHHLQPYSYIFTCRNQLCRGYSQRILTTSTSSRGPCSSCGWRLIPMPPGASCCQLLAEWTTPSEIGSWRCMTLTSTRSSQLVLCVQYVSCYLHVRVCIIASISQ